MAPKKATTSAPKKSTPATHPSYKDMIKDAIVNLKDRSGSSRQAIKKYIHANNNLGSTTDAAFNNHISAALANGVKSGDFEMPKGASGPTKLAKKGASKPAAKGDKKPATKKAAPKKTTTAKPKTTTAKPKTTTKANVGKKAAPKKPAAAPAIQTKEPVVLGKTKSGRVTKSSAPTPALPKKAAARKPAAKKASTKKAATPKKAEAKAETAA